MSEMVERVARAIEAETRRQLDQIYVDPPLEYESIARAAILAMREPTQVLIDAGACVRTGEGDDTTGRDLAADIWQAMIDAAVTP